MIGYHGGQAVREGLYLKLSTQELESVAKGGGVLHGKAGMRYIKLPLPLVAVEGPLAGLLYVLTLPIVLWVAFVYFVSLWTAKTLKVKVIAPLAVRLNYRQR